MILSFTTTGWIHAAFAMLGILLGFVQLLRPKGGRVHRVIGYAYVSAMLIADGTAMVIFQFTGKFNILHAGAIANGACIAAALVPFLQRPRPSNWKVRHYRWITGSYLGLLAATATELLVRTTPFATRGQIWAATAIATTVVTVVGCLLIARYHPPRKSAVETIAAGEVASR